MKMENGKGPSIVFMGTPEFAVASLSALVTNGYHVVGVITAPDKPAGRGMKLNTSAVKKYAEENGLPVLQPEKLKDPGFLESLKALNADLQVVVAFRMLPEVVWNMPTWGTINVHASLLPRYRGAAPINWAVINGESKTGVTTFKLTHEIDTGNILLQQEVPIGENETAGDIHDKLKDVGAALLIKTIEGLVAGTIREQPQDSLISKSNEGNDANKTNGANIANDPMLTHAPKIFTETCRIDWFMPVKNIHNLIRGLSPFPGAFTQWEGKMLKIFRSEYVQHQPTHEPGSFETDAKQFLRFAGTDGYIYVKEMQIEGKKRMKVEDFLRGYKNTKN